MLMTGTVDIKLDTGRKIQVTNWNWSAGWGGKFWD
jgi:hypothetical protein